MTVCIAAICHAGPEPYIIGATDNRLTAGDTAFEPPTAKLFALGPGIAALFSGDVAAQTHICYEVAHRGAHAVKSVRDAVDAYCVALIEYNRVNAERQVLAPHGLTTQSFLLNQHGMSEKFIQSLQYSVTEVKAEVETIICGIDRAGAHLYTIDPDGCAKQRTAIGFAAVGEGARHAAGQFMFAKYTPKWTIEPTLVLLYTAKKRAELATSVGEATEMFFFTRSAGLETLNDELLAELKQAYDHIHSAQKQATTQANQRIVEFFDRQEKHTATSIPIAPDSAQDQPSKLEGSA